MRERERGKKSAPSIERKNKHVECRKKSACVIPAENKNTLVLYAMDFLHSSTRSWTSFDIFIQKVLHL